VRERELHGEWYIFSVGSSHLFIGGSRSAKLLSRLADRPSRKLTGHLGGEAALPMVGRPSDAPPSFSKDWDVFWRPISIDARVKHVHATNMVTRQSGNGLANIVRWSTIHVYVCLVSRPDLFTFFVHTLAFRHCI
jgi:hypothetical protein